MRWRAGVAVGMLVCSPAVSAHASPALGPVKRPPPQVIERVIAVVARQPITLWDLHSRMAPRLEMLRAQGKVTAVKERTLAATMLEQLIDERIVALQAAELSLAVSEQDVDRAAARVAEQTSMAVEELYARAQSEAHLDKSHYRAELRRQLLAAKVMQIAVVSRLPAGSSIAQIDAANRRWMAAERKRRKVRVLVSW